MCCRYYFSDQTKDERVSRILSMMERDYPGQYKTGEIFPGDTAAALLGENGKLRLAPAVFGLPGFKEKQRILNARAETAALKPLFAEAFRARRAVLPAEGFYEWSRGETKTKYLFTLAGGRTLYLCGIWNVYDGKYRFAILTRPANASMKDIHDRMPVIASADEVRAYLTDYGAAQRIAAEANPYLYREPAEKERLKEV